MLVIGCVCLFCHVGHKKNFIYTCPSLQVLLFDAISLMNSPKKKKKKLSGTFLWMGFNCLKASATSRTQSTFYHLVPRYSWYSFYRPRKDERLSWPWSQPVVLNTGPLDWKSNALTTRSIFSSICWSRKAQIMP